MLMLQFLSVSFQSKNTKYANGLEVMHSDIDSVTTDQARIKGHLNAQFV